ncbi:Hypothetical predicted protein [Lecanosticta acicola]|uniref:Glycosyltransferase family 34 protein n=1 Tax=Lecanosticta acicola TaxID=111012 RepID=A0AAI8YPN4_9PEZI|nr:Hypothetical predicted protein [Lecanosticta acicola]
MRSNVLGRCAIALIFTTSIILTFWQFASIYRRMQQYPPSSYTPQDSTSYTFTQSKATNNRPTKVIRIDRSGRLEPRIGVCTVVEEHNPPTQTAFTYASRHPTFFVSQPILDGLWSKEAALLEVLEQELSGPGSRRLQWLVWNDLDAPILDSRISFEDLLPPDERQDVQLLHAKGMMMLKVSNWSIAFLSAVTARQAMCDEECLYDWDRHPTQDVLRSEDFKYQTVEIPTWWSEPCHGEEEWGMSSKKLERMRAFWNHEDLVRRSRRAGRARHDDPRERLWD